MDGLLWCQFSECKLKEIFIFLILSAGIRGSRHKFHHKKYYFRIFFGLEFYGYGVILFNYCETLKAFITVLTRISFFFYQIYTNIHKIIFFIQLVYKYWILYTSTKTEMYLLPINTNRVYTFHFIHFFFIHSLIVK